jgi:RNA-directed DNA polymerase
MPGPQIPDHILTKLLRIAELARKAPNMVFRTLAHHIDVELLRVAYQLTRKSGAVGVDGVSAEAYAEDLEANLASLLNRFKSGTYRAPPVRRVHIPKGDGKTRPIGVPTFEDKILQRAVTMVLNAVYEEDFLGFSYGFRPQKSAHQALAALRAILTDMGGGWVLDVDIKAFFDSLVPSHLRTFLDQRVVDGVLRRAIDKWLKAGVTEDGKQSFPELGTPQGGVISPLLANIYLHEVLDQWFVREVQPRLAGRAELIRFADDFVIVCLVEQDARRVLEVLPQRFAKYGLTIHPEKTRLVAFRKPGPIKTRTPLVRVEQAPGTFDLLGFTHYWAKSRKGNWAVFRKTESKRFGKAADRIDDWCRANRHLPVKRQHKLLSTKLRGHYNYYGVAGNSRNIDRFRCRTLLTWKFWLNRRAQHGTLTWKRFERIKKRYPLPPARLPQRAPRHEQTQITRSRMR